MIDVQDNRNQFEPVITRSRALPKWAQEWIMKIATRNEKYKNALQSIHNHDAENYDGLFAIAREALKEEESN